MGLMGDKRLPDHPDFPTLAEQGLPILQRAWLGLVVGSGTPKDRIDILNAALRKGVAAADYQEAMKKLTITPTSSSVSEMNAFIKEDYSRWTEILKPLNLKLD